MATVSAPLSDISDLRIGQAARGALPVAPDGARHALTSGTLDLLESGRVEGLPRLPDDELQSARALEDGDVVLLGRNGLRAVAWQGPPGLVVPFSPLVVLRVTRLDLADPRYIAAILNLPSVRARAEAQMQGTSIRMLGNKEIAAIKIALPPIARQRLIVELVELQASEAALLRDLSQARSRLLAALCAAD
ncbi:MAG: hypothetical protein VX463_04440 [Pseudomonadota bacterium]|nr:hypothetical protein [Pseudomonadota bacterium]